VGPYPENGAQRTLGVEDFLCLGLARRGGGRFPLFLSTYPFGVNGRLKTRINQSIDTVGLGASLSACPASILIDIPRRVFYFSKISIFLLHVCTYIRPCKYTPVLLPARLNVLAACICLYTPVLLPIRLSFWRQVGRKLGW
jgi:hypothetical protein